MQPDLFRAQAYNNAWANHRLLTACAGLTPAELAAPRIGFFPSLIATLNHIHIVDLFYIDALEGGWLGTAAFADRIPLPELPALHAAQAALDRRLIAQSTGIDGASEVRINRGTRVQVERRDRLLLHLFQHQVHHRGQAHAMLSGTGVAPPQLDDFFPATDAPLRAADFAALGFTEAAIWG